MNDDNINTVSLDFSRPLIMGILNVTPDSFSDGGTHHLADEAVEHAMLMQRQGADIIDIGGESTRPGSDKVDYQEEKRRVMPVVEQLIKTDMILSIDTTKAKLADDALTRGAHIINDVWGFQLDPEMADVAAKHQALSILMHNSHDGIYGDDIIKDLLVFFEKSVEIAQKAGLPETHIVLDPGIGFAKTARQNVEILRRLNELVAFGLPVLLGTSRKSTIGKILDLPVDQRVEGTLATTALGIQSGVDIIRVHDIVENVRTIKVADAIIRGNCDWI